MACSTNLCFSASISSPSASCSSGSYRFLAIQHVSSAPSLFRWTTQYKQSGHTLYRRSHMLAFASADVPQVKRSSGDNVVMVDPLEAKRLAAKQMQEIRAKEKLKSRRQAEAVNGALAMIGLTAGLVVEGQTGKSILEQLAAYLAAIYSLLGQESIMFGDYFLTFVGQESRCLNLTCWLHPIFFGVNPSWLCNSTPRFLCLSSVLPWAGH